LITVAPLGFVGHVGIVHLYQRHRIKRSVMIQPLEAKSRKGT
jgi:hypothetical protein